MEKKKTKMILIQRIHAVKLVCTHRALDKVQLKKSDYYTGLSKSWWYLILFILPCCEIGLLFGRWFRL